MKPFAAFVAKESRHILRDKRTMLILLGMPVLMMFLFGFAITTDVKDVRTVVVTSAMNAGTSKTISAISQSEYFDITCLTDTPAEAEALIRAQKADVAIVFSSEFGQRDSGLQIIVDGTDPNMAQQYSNLITQIAAQSMMGGTMKPLVTSRLLYNPSLESSFNFVPGIMGLVLIIICAMMTSVSIVREKERGTMEVLLVSPMKPIMIIVCKAIPYMVFSCIILALILLIAKFVLGVPLAGNLLLIILISLLYIVMALALGLLVSTVAKTQVVALLVSAIGLMVPSVMLSGLMFPIESMPKILQWLSAVLPPRYFVAAMRKLMIMGTGFASIAKETLILCLMTLLFMGVSLKKFSKRLDI